VPGSRREVLMWLAASGLGAGSEPALAQDAAKTEPAQYTVLFENDKVRVLSMLRVPGTAFVARANIRIPTMSR
jgi:hypothetical protein